MKKIRIIPLLLIFILLLIPLGVSFGDIAFQRGGLSDTGNILGGDASRVQQALEDVYDETGSQVFVALTQNPNTRGLYFDEWVEAVFREQSIGSNDLLLIIDTEAREFSWTVEESYKLSDNQLENIMNTRLIPELREDKWAEGIIQAAEGIKEGFSNPGASSGGSILRLFRPSLIIAVIFIVGLLFFRNKGKRGTGAETPEAKKQVPLKELEQQAGLKLVDVDDSIKSSEQELAFTEAEFGPQAVTEYRKVIREAKELLSKAFNNQQKTYDLTEEDPERRRLVEEIISLTTKADEILDEKADGFKELRDLVGHVEEALPRIRSQFEQVKAAFPERKNLLDQLKQAYTLDALGEVHDDDEQAEELIVFTEERLANAKTSIEEGDKNQAAVSLRAAEDAVYQIDRYGEAINQMDRELQDAETDLRHQISYVRELTSNKTIDKPELAAELAKAKTMNDALEQELLRRPNNPIKLLSELEKSVSGLEASLKGYQEQQEQERQLISRVQSTIKNTQNRIASVESYVATRRGNIGARARSLLDQANVELQHAHALIRENPQESYQHATRARSYADQASTLAQSDVGGYSQSRSMGGSGDLLTGAILSGILRGGFGGGGSSRRSSGGFGGGSIRTGGFGGSSRGGMRGGRGRF